MKRPDERTKTRTDALDRVLTHRWWGTLVFAAVMLVMFSSIFIVAEQPMAWIDGGFAAIADWVESSLAEGPLRSLLADGLVGGVGSVVVFLPQILILFLFIAILEDCGYMARAAYLMDKLMVSGGLERQVVHSAVLVVRLRDSGCHGHARDRESARPADDDPRGAVDELLGAAAGVCAVDRRVHSAARLPRRVACACKGSRFLRCTWSAS